MSVKKGQILKAEISDLAFGGKGVVKIDGFVVFVEQAAPGDVAEIQVYRKKKSYAEAKILNLLEPSPFRVEPPCPYSGFCGGCKWQFIGYETQIEYKRRHVVESLSHLGGIPDPPVNPVIAAPKPFFYRNKMEFSCADRRWLPAREMENAPPDPGFSLGLHVPGTFHKVLDINACLLQPELGNDILRAAREHLRASGLPAYGLKSHEGFWRFLMVRHSVAHDEWMVNIITAWKEPAAMKSLAGVLMNAFPNVVSVVNNVTARHAGVAVGEFEEPVAGKSMISDRLFNYEFGISANSFFQTNTQGAERLYETVRSAADLTGKERVLDLYSGTGTIPVCLSAHAESITGIEIVSSAVADARENCSQNRIDNCRFLEGDMRTVLPTIETPPDVIIIDPPRDGMHPDVVRQVLQLSAPRIVYVSCNPATLARDLGLMKEKYRLHFVQPVDMFPQTPHIEAVAKLSLR